MENEFMNQIKNKSGKLHDMAENTGFIKRLLNGNATKESYGEYIYNLYAIYKSIEDGLEKNKNNDTVKDFALEEVYRSDALIKDAKFLLGDEINNINLLESTISFVNRINEISNTNPELLVAHAYTRYLADLFGGRTIYGIVKEKYGIDSNGLNYYIFDKISDLKAFVMNYHAKLNNINLNNEIKSKFLEEIALSYIYNISISNELDYNRFCKKITDRF